MLSVHFLRLKFVYLLDQGCDASLLLDDSNGNLHHLIERNAIPNRTINSSLTE